ncbi:diguanylate cyclase [Trinickia caryophylli]|uniref:Diguanylate cyclase n=1 Tax=Trinickia caryophylli TaxID=28094 RepID=A0A1X7HC71_TRICW|nr:diguanylate cyclase [Trinickia caryophylli]PMS13657.1 HAMP domain-containing protein [Trinickia caryophylli]TRX14151.1 diguanylate cyclase [Trinickia caryophylli]WQE13972.1 diguanylate cyclase [Trinickia caryophylli]SMF83031.1 diguanylate cyclase [Trinickia caryophylli]
MMKLGLTSQLLVLVATIGVAASGATGYYAYRANRAMLADEARRNLITSTKLLGQRFTTVLKDVADDALVLAAMPSAATVASTKDNGSGATAPGNTPADRRRRLQQVFISFMLHHPDYLQIRLISRDEYGLERVRLDRAPGGIVVVPDEGLQEKGQFAYVFDTLGLAPGHIYLSPIGINREDGTHAAEGRPTVRVATPIAAPGNPNAGVLVIDVDLTKVFSRLARDLPERYQVYMANRWGDFLVHPDPSLTFGFERGRRVLMQDSFPATKPLFEQLSGRIAASGLAEASDTQIFAFTRTPFGDSTENGFVVLGLTRPLSDVLIPANALGTRIVHMVLVSSFLALMLAILFARALTKPLHTLARAATRVFDQPDNEKLPVERSDEIGILARCFASMRREIQLQMMDLHAKQRELTHLAGHDALTGLPNRMLFMNKLDAAIRKASETGATLAVIFVDLDRFKQINDQLGHRAGDQTLVAVAERLTNTLRHSDVAARLGGDEFIVLVTDAQAPDAVVEIAARIVEAMNEVLRVGEAVVQVGASIGISEFPTDGTTAEELLHKADAAMYAAKFQRCGSYRRYQELLAHASSVSPPGALS